MSLLVILKEGGSLLIDSIGGPISEDIDLLPEISVYNYNLRFMLWDPSYKLQVGISADEMMLLGV